MSAAVAWVVPTYLSPELMSAVEEEVRSGLLHGGKKTLSPWLFYDAAGSELFESITALPEYYLTRTERDLFRFHGHEMVERAAAGEELSLLELGAGSASKTGLLLADAVEMQGHVTYYPVDVSPTALDAARATLERSLPGVQVEPQVANYVTEPLIRPKAMGRTLALYIGSSIGNFSPTDAKSILGNLGSHLRKGDSLLLGTDLVKNEEVLLAAYNDAAGVTAAFNLNVLHRLNRELGADFDCSAFRHLATWNERESRMEMHLQSVKRQSVWFPTLKARVEFEAGETLHTENSYKFTKDRIQAMLQDAGFEIEKQWCDENEWFAVTLARIN